MIKKLTCIAALFTGLACFNVAQADDYYQELGGKEGVEKIVDNFINEISFDQNIVKFFEGTDITRLREKLIEQFCHESGGPCEYTGDSMKDVHAGMRKFTEPNTGFMVMLFIPLYRRLQQVFSISGCLTEILQTR